MKDHNNGITSRRGAPVGGDEETGVAETLFLVITQPMSALTLRVHLLGHLVHLLYDAAISKMRAPLHGGRGATRMMAGVQGRGGPPRRNGLPGVGLAWPNGSFSAIA